MKIILDQPGYIRGNAKIGDRFDVPDEVGQPLIDAKVAHIDETEAIQAAEIEGQRAELAVLIEQLQAANTQLEQAKTESVQKDATITSLQGQVAELSAEIATLSTVQGQVEALTAALEERDAEIAEFKATGVTPLPEDYPARDILIGEGITTDNAAKALGKEGLEAIKGIGPKLADEILSY